MSSNVLLLEESLEWGPRSLSTVRHSYAAARVFHVRFIGFNMYNRISAMTRLINMDDSVLQQQRCGKIQGQ